LPVACKIQHLLTTAVYALHMPINIQRGQLNHQRGVGLQ